MFTNDLEDHLNDIRAIRQQTKQASMQAQRDLVQAMERHQRLWILNTTNREVASIHMELIALYQKASEQYDRLLTLSPQSTPPPIFPI